MKVYSTIARSIAFAGAVVDLRPWLVVVLQGHRLRLNAPVTRLKKSSSSKVRSTGANLLKRMSWERGGKESKEKGRGGEGERREKGYAVE